MINFLRSKIDFKASRSPYETSNPDVKCARYAQVHNRINEEGERRQQTHYFHCDGGGSDGALDLKGLNPPGRKLVCINKGVDT